MPRSSRHKSHRHSKHSSKEYSDSDEDVVVKVKERSSKDENASSKGYRDSASGEKRKSSSSSQAREGKDRKDGNGEAMVEYVSSKRRKEKSDAGGGDRWNGGGDERVESDRIVEKETVLKGESLKVDLKMKEISDKGESLRIESKSKSKRYESGSVGERKEDSSAPVLMEKEESKGKGESKKRSERDSSSRKEGKESKDKDRRSDKEKVRFQESKSGDAEDKLLDINVRKKHGAEPGDISEERQKRARENSECPVQEESRKPELVREIEKRVSRRREGSSEKDKHKNDSKDGDEKRLTTKTDYAKNVKYRDDNHNDVSYADKYLEDGDKSDKRRDEKQREKDDKDTKHQGHKYRDDGEKEAKRSDDRLREDGERESRRKDEKYHEDGERDSRRKDDKYLEAIERDGRRNDKYPEDGEGDDRRRDDRNHEDGDKDLRQGDGRYYDDGDRDERRRLSKYKDDGNRDSRRKEEKYRDDIEREVRSKDIKQGEDKRLRDTNYKDENISRHRSADKSNPKRSKDDSYAADNHSRSAYDYSPTQDGTARYRDDQGKRRTNEKDEYSDFRSRGTRDQRSDAEKKSVSCARTDLVAERVRSTSKNADIELSSIHSRKRSSPTSSSHAPRDHYRIPKQDETKYRDYNYDERDRHNITPTRDYAGAIGGSEKNSSSRSLEKTGLKDGGYLGELSSERRLKSDKSPSPSTDRRQFGRPDGRRSTDVEEFTPRSGGSRDVDPDTVSASSPFTRNSHFSNTSKSFQQPPPFRTGVESPSQFGSTLDDNRGKSNMRHNRRFGDSNMGRIQSNAWRGVPTWPSPVGNGFLHFPPPPVNFPTVMQPFPAPPMFGVRPSMQLSHPSPYPMRPMGWRNPVEDSYPPLHSWDASHAVFGDYGRSDWDHSRSGRGWGTSEELSKAPNLEISSSEKENNSARSADEAFADQSVQPAQIEQTLTDQQVESTSVSRLTKNFETNDVETPLLSLEETSESAKISRKDDVPLWHLYLSKLDISDDLTEPELFNKCAGLIVVGESVVVDEAKIVFMEEAVEAKMASHKNQSCTLFASTDGSVFQKAISLYKRSKGNISAEDGDKPKVLSEFIPNGNNEEDDSKTDKLCPADDMLGVENALSNFDIVEDPQNTLQTDLPVADLMETSEEPISTSNHVDMEVNSMFDLGPQENDVVVEDVPMEDDNSNNKEVKLVDTKCVSLLNTDVSFEAKMPESVNLSRIHHSPESTH